MQVHPCIAGIRPAVSRRGGSACRSPLSALAFPGGNRRVLPVLCTVRKHSDRAVFGVRPSLVLGPAARLHQKRSPPLAWAKRADRSAVKANARSARRGSPCRSPPLTRPAARRIPGPDPRSNTRRIRASSTTRDGQAAADTGGQGEDDLPDSSQPCRKPQPPK
jgi:hypothetical protein